MIFVFTYGHGFGHFQNMLIQKPPFIFVLQVRGGHIWNQHEKLAIPAEFHGPSSSLLHVTWLTPLKGVSKGYNQGIKWDLFPISTKIDNRFVLDVKLGVDVKNDTHFHV